MILRCLFVFNLNTCIFLYCMVCWLCVLQIFTLLVQSHKSVSRDHLSHKNSVESQQNFDHTYSRLGGSAGCVVVKNPPAPVVGDGQGGLACCNSWGRRESDTTVSTFFKKFFWPHRPACRIYVLRPGIKTWALLHGEHRDLASGPPRKSPLSSCYTSARLILTSSL